MQDCCPTLATFQATPTNTTVVTLFTCPNKSVAEVKAVVLTVPGNTGDTATFHLVKKGDTLDTTTALIIKTIGSATSEIVPVEVGMEAGDTLKVVMGVGNRVNINTEVEIKSIYN